MDALQLRIKQGGDDSVWDLARECQELCKAHGAAFYLDDRAQLAQRLATYGTVGIHVGKDDPCPLAIRKSQPSIPLGVTSYGDPMRYTIAASCGAQYVGTGKVYPTQTKPDVPVRGIDGLRSLNAFRTGLEAISERGDSNFKWPFLVAIGGVTSDNVLECLEAGADSVAIVSAIMDMPPDATSDYARVEAKQRAEQLTAIMNKAGYA
eukprot:Hpha_TRINITY_DN12017_c0_g3::TRINITY_DN12017_c0_g3_i2::g.141087::m.141087/K00788/thiE; thiamine-phosphate pyrophosphorylase